MLEFHKLRVFCTVLETGSFSIAARRLHLSQPVVSAHIKDMEMSTGVKLIDRSRRPVSATDVGRLVYEAAHKALQTVNEVETILAGVSSGRYGFVNISTTSMIGSVILPPMLADFRETHPGIDVRVKVGNPEAVLDQVRTGSSQIGVLISRKPSSHFKTTPAGPIELAIVQKRTSEMVSRRFNLSEVIEEKGVAAPHNNVEFIAVVEKLFHRYGIKKIPVRFETGSWEAAKRSVLHGMGVAVLPRAWVDREIENHQLEELKPNRQILETPVNIVHLERGSLSPPAKELLNFLVQAFKRGSGGEPLKV